MRDKHDNLTYMQKVFDETVVIQKPVHRVIKGYHQLPYIMVGYSIPDGSATMEIRGRIHVSPRMIVRPGDSGQTYGEVFGEENVEPAIVARLFGFLYLKEGTARFTSEDLSIRTVPIRIEKAIARILDEMAREECIDTGLIHSPDMGLYPVSVDRYIREMLDRELSTGTFR